jgi:hypothetical protein
MATLKRCSNFPQNNLNRRGSLKADLQAIGENFRRLAAVLEPHVKTNQAGTT